MQPFFNKNITCAVCNYTYTTKKLRSRFIKIIKHDTDFCSYYQNPLYNPLLYYVNVCPKCGYACSDKFSQYFPPHTFEKIKLELCNKWNGKNYNKQRSFLDGVQTYKLGIYSGTLKKEKHINMAGLYLRLAWLYRLYSSDSKEEMRFMELALEQYLQSFLYSDYEDTHFSELKLLYLIGELSYRVNNRKQAIRFFSKVIEKQNQTSEKYIVEMARDQWYELRTLK